ncbi:hypothetical protein RM780_13670 [Streptomyces sp. DSM 44917]|uniref:DUF1918 domain-containing protein n=1 Tax=Streptomyces boetiae TaxID=3075541 RepID=A0ABU2L950_9ACTN|nr:hypothetical protein [Streptomyces sp. DSM 44917]MDT0308006.1 hypothetical protein [Streptomyces sp. DSM 44917]
MKRERAGRPVVISGTVDAATVRRGDQVLVGGAVWTVHDIAGAPGGCRWLEFESGERMLMRPHTVFYATRSTRPRPPQGP